MNNKGFTLIELIVALAISSLILIAVGTFLVFNLRSFNATNDIINIQYEGQLALNQLADIAKASKGIDAIEDMTGDDRLNESGELIPGEIQFSHYAYNALLDVDERTTFIINFVPGANVGEGILRCTIIDNDGSVIDAYIMAKYIDAFSVNPEANENFGSSRTLSVSATFAEKDAAYDLQTEMKFRNKH